MRSTRLSTTSYGADVLHPNTNTMDFVAISSLFQMTMIFGGLTAATGLTERLETLRKSS